MSVLVSIPSQNYSPNTRQFESPAGIISADATLMRVTLTRENWPGTQNDSIGSIGLEVSTDGVNYPPISGASTELMGGTILGRDGVTPIAQQYVECTLPGVGLTTRRVRAVCINNQTLRTAITVETF